MEVTIDRFGRILIPKSVRKMFGLSAGHKFDLIPNEDNQSIDLVPKDGRKVELTITETGIPVFRSSGQEVLDFDVVEQIRKSRNDRDAKVMDHGG